MYFITANSVYIYPKIVKYLSTVFTVRGGPKNYRNLKKII
jgi:hypothetical protein